MSTALTMSPPMSGSVGAEQPEAQDDGDGGGATMRLNGRQKAAIIVRLLLAEGAEFTLTDLPEKVQADLVWQMSILQRIDEATVRAVVDEFLGAFHSGGLKFPTAVEDALKMMEGRISPKLTTKMRKQAGLSAIPDPWKRIRELDHDVLLGLLDKESTEVGAVVLSKLKVTDAAQLLGRMPGERARRIAYAVSLTADISPAVVQKIGQSLAEQLEHQPEREFDEDPVERVGAILNFSPAATRDEVLNGLEETDAEFASQVRNAIFTFADVPDRISATDIAKVTRAVDPAQLVMALAGARDKDAVTAEFILSNMSKRMADSLREEIAELGKVKLKDAEAAMTAVVIAIRELVDAGEIALLQPEEEEED